MNTEIFGSRQMVPGCWRRNRLPAGCQRQPGKNCIISMRKTDIIWSLPHRKNCRKVRRCLRKKDIWLRNWRSENSMYFVRHWHRKTMWDMRLLRRRPKRQTGNWIRPRKKSVFWWKMITSLQSTIWRTSGRWEASLWPKRENFLPESVRTCWRWFFSICLAVWSRHSLMYLCGMIFLHRMEPDVMQNGPTARARHWNLKKMWR